MRKKLPIVLATDMLKDDLFSRQYVFDSLFPKPCIEYTFDMPLLEKLLARQSQRPFACTQCGRMPRGTSTVYISIDKKSGKRNQMVDYICVPCNQVCSSSEALLFH